MQQLSLMSLTGGGESGDLKAVEDAFMTAAGVVDVFRKEGVLSDD